MRAEERSRGPEVQEWHGLSKQTIDCSLLTAIPGHLLLDNLVGVSFASFHPVDRVVYHESCDARLPFSSEQQEGLKSLHQTTF